MKIVIDNATIEIKDHISHETWRKERDVINKSVLAGHPYKPGTSKIMDDILDMKAAMTSGVSFEDMCDY